MQTLLLGDTKKDIEKAAELLRSGEAVAFPTETVYGLGADAFNEDAVRKVFYAKERPLTNPINVLLARKSDAEFLSSEITEDVRKLMDAFWPGALTIIVKALPEIIGIVTAGGETIGIRMPNDDTALSLIKAAGGPLATASANLSGRPSPTMAKHVVSDMNRRIAGIVDGGNCVLGIESTIVDMSLGLGKAKILRPGSISRDEIENVLGYCVTDSEDEAPADKLKHYSPKAKMILYTGDEQKISCAIDNDKTEFEKQGLSTFVIKFKDAEEASVNFFSKLREADEEGAEVILCAGIPDSKDGYSVMNRMRKASAGRIKEL